MLDKIGLLEFVMEDVVNSCEVVLLNVLLI